MSESAGDVMWWWLYGNPWNVPWREPQREMWTVPWYAMNEQLRPADPEEVERIKRHLLGDPDPTPTKAQVDAALRSIEQATEREQGDEG